MINTIHDFFMRRISIFTIALLITTLLGGSLSIRADDADHEEARRLRQAGDILSLEAILERLRPTHPGKVLEVELEKEHGRIIYEIELLAEDDQSRSDTYPSIEVDAKNGEVLRSKVDD